MLASNYADTNWSEKKMEGDDGLRTLECLRGRLLAERASSRVAKEDAELMGKKLIELENQLRTETKSKNRAEKKLKSLMKKLESLKTTFVLEESEQSSSSENWEASCGSSSTTKHPEEEQGPKSQITDTEKCTIEEVIREKNSPKIFQNLKQSVSETTLQSNQIPPSEEISSSSATTTCGSSSTTKHLEEEQEPKSQITDTEKCTIEEVMREKNSLKISQNLKQSVSETTLQSNQIPPGEEISSSSATTTANSNSKTDEQSSNSSMGGGLMEINGEEDNDEEDYVDNSLALVLVPASLQAASQNGEMKRVSGSVGDVLEALRHAREKLQSSMERRHLIKVGSIDTMIC